jgi:hypothetical protein
MVAPLGVHEDNDSSTGFGGFVCVLINESLFAGTHQLPQWGGGFDRSSPHPLGVGMAFAFLV